MTTPASETSPFQFQLAPSHLWQAINPWVFSNPDAQFGLVNISIGQTRHPEVERAVLEEVGSYGRQLGHIGDALDVLIAHFDQSALGQQERDALSILTGELAEIRKIKARELKRNGKPTG